MQTTLLGLGIAIILALVAALVGPHFVDWSAYRSTFEAEATRIVGMPVRIAGTIDARLLPSPSLTLRDLEGRKANGEPKFTAREISVEFGLGALMRGQWRVSEMHVIAPRIGVGLAADGRVDWVGTEAGIDPNSLAIEHLTIDEGRVILADAASGSWIALNTFTFAGALRSLAGPINGDGTFATRDGQHAYHLAAGRIGDDGAMRVRLTVDPGDPPVSAQLDGKLSFDKAAPQFEGTLQLARAPSVSLSHGRAVTNEPWTLTTKIATTSARATLDQLQLTYGADERAMKLGGTAELKFGPRARLDATMSARQLDLDRFVALPEQTRRLPLMAIRAAADALGDVLRPTLPVHVGLSVDTLTLAEGALQSVHGDFSSEDGDWSVDALDLRAPGITDLHASGRLTTAAQGVSFSGPTTIKSADPTALATWLQGGAWSGDRIGALEASGAVTLAPDRFVVDRLAAEFDHKSISGRLDYAGMWQGKGPRLEATLKAADLDLDGTIAFLRNALPGTRLDMPVECVLALDIDHATVAGIEANRTKAKLRLDPDGLAVDELTIGDLGGMTVALTGQVQGPWSAPAGTLALALDGRRFDGLVSLLAKSAPQTADALRAVAPRLGAAKLKLAVVLDPARNGGGNAGATPASTATLHLDGTLGPMRIAWSGVARANPSDWKLTELRSDAQIDAADGRTLAALIGLDQKFAVGAGAGSLRVTANSALNDAVAIKGQLALAGAMLSGDGVARLGPDGMPAGRAEISATVTDATVLRPVTARPDQPAALTFKARLAFENNRFEFDNLIARLADGNLSGKIVLTTRPLRLDGRLDSDRLPLEALLGALAGMPTPRDARPATSMWPSETFGSRFLADASGRIDLKAAHASLGPKFDIQQFQTTLRLKPDEATLEDVRGVLAGARLTGSATLQRGVDGIATNFRLGLSGADIATLLSAGARPPIAGRVSLQIEAKGSGRSPAALVETLGGFGSVSGEGLELAGLDPIAFDIAARMADQGVQIDPSRLKSLIEPLLARDHLRLQRLDGAFTVATGQLRLGGVVAHSDKADLGLSAMVDLTNASLDARLTLVGSGAITSETGGRPEISVLLKGPLTAPQRNVDVSTLAGWLTLRAVDQQAKRLEAAEAERRKVDEAARRIEETARQAAEQRRAADAAEQVRRAAEAAEQQQRAADAARAQALTPQTSPSSEPSSEPASEPATGQVAPLPPPIEIRPLPGQQRRSEARPAPHVARPEQETSVIRPPPVFQRDPRLPP